MKKMKKEKNSPILKFINKLLICIIIFLGLAIISKSNPTYKNKIYNYLYQNNINFSTFKNIYNKYLGGVLPTRQTTASTENYVFNEQIKYNSINPYENGAILKVENNYLVPNLENGIVVYIGEKEKYKSVIMIETNEGIDIWYGNICNSSLKLYDNVETNSYIGESCDDTLYMVFSKGNTFLDYKNYIA